ncbi:MAG: hypothetical protein WC148_02580 [Bacilli bacterium]|jgi:hypothetical protein
MKYTKTQALLFIKDELFSNKFIVRQDIESTLEINDLTFHRYIEELRAYFSNFNLPYDVIYDRNKEIYRLKKE